jgi:hypothetical protein
MVLVFSRRIHAASTIYRSDTLQSATASACTPKPKSLHLALLAGIQGKLPGAENKYLNPHEFTREHVEEFVISAVKENPELFPPEYQNICSRKHLPLLVRGGYVDRIGISLYYKITHKGQLADFDYEVAA